MALPNAKENRFSSSGASPNFSSSLFAFPAGFSFHLAGPSPGLPRLSSPIASPSLSPGSGASPAAQSFVGGGGPTALPPAQARGSGLGFEGLPFTWPIRKVTASVNSAMWLYWLSLASLFASNSAIIALSILSWFCNWR